MKEKKDCIVSIGGQAARKFLDSLDADYKKRGLCLKEEDISRHVNQDKP